MTPSRHAAALAGRRPFARTLSLVLAAGACCLTQPAGAYAEAAPLTLGAPFGEHDGLRVADDAAGDTAIAWRTTTGEGQSIDLAEIPAGASEASPVETVVGAPQRLSMPALAISPGGRVAVAWFEERATVQEWGEDALAVKVRERAPDGAWGPVRTLWRAPAKPVYGPESLAVSLDDAGAAAVVWAIEPEKAADPRPVPLLVSTSKAGGVYGIPATLDADAAEADPAIALTPSGEVTALWAGPWRSAAGGLYTETWAPGSPPPNNPSELDELPATEAHGNTEPPFHGLSLQTARSGEELATWLRGPRGQNGRPEPVALRAAWRTLGGTFQPPQTVTPPEVEAREPVLDLANQARALLAWSEITADGAGPLLNHATAAAGASLAASSPIAASFGEQDTLFGEANLAATWLPGGRALLAWATGERELADDITPGVPPGPEVRIGRNQAAEPEASSSALVTVGGSEAAAPVEAWIGRSPADFSGEGLRYVIGANLPAFSTSPVPSARLVGKRDLANVGVEVRVACPQACTGSIGGTVYSLRYENNEDAGAAAYAALGSLTPVRLALPTGGSRLLRLKLPRGTHERFCRTARRGNAEAVEIAAAITDSGGAQRHLVLGEQPNARGCGR